MTLTRHPECSIEKAPAPRAPATPGLTAARGSLPSPGAVGSFSRSRDEPCCRFRGPTLSSKDCSPPRRSRSLGCLGCR